MYTGYIPATCDRLMMVTVEYARCVVTMGVGSIIDARIRLWSRTRVLERPSVVSAPGKGVEGMQLNASTELQHGQTCTLAICLR